MPRGEVRVVIQRELRCDRCGNELAFRKDGLIFFVSLCERCVDKLLGGKSDDTAK